MEGSGAMAGFRGLDMSDGTDGKPWQSYVRISVLMCVLCLVYGCRYYVSGCVCVRLQGAVVRFEG